MKRHILIFALTMLIALPAWSRQRNINESENIALKALEGHRTKSKSLTAQTISLKTVRSSEILKRADITPTREAFFICAPQNGNKGYVLVSGDDRMPDILAIGDEAFDANNIPENMQLFLNDYAEALKAIESGSMTAKQIFAPQLTGDEITIEPLLGGIKYNQNDPYNQQCPTLKTGKKAATGCVATAFAQVMRYHRWPQDFCTGADANYVSKTSTDTFNIKYNFSGLKLDWDNMMESYSKLGTEYTGTTTVGSTEFVTYSTMFYKSGYDIVVDSLLGCNEQVPFDGKVQILLTDESGKLLQPVGTAKTLAQLKKGSYYKTYTITFSMPGSYPDGNYRFYLGTQYTGTNAWTFVKHASPWSDRYTASKRKPFYINVVKQGAKFYIGENEFVCEYAQKNADAVAQLMAACGASVSMQYGSSSSASTSTIAKVANTYFGYDIDATYISFSYMSNDGAHRLLQKEISEQRPVIFRGTNDSGGGHSFVLDGVEYRYGTPYYHVNWGWGGSSNGYFSLALLKPSEAGTGGSASNYSHSNAMIINMQPENNTHEYTLYCRNMSELDSCYIMPGGNMNITVDGIQNLGVRAYTGTASICLIDAKGNITPLKQIYSISALKQNYYLTSSSSVNVTIPADMPYGDYTVSVCGNPSDGGKCVVGNPYEQVIHIVAEDPSNAMDGVLRYTFDDESLTAKVRRFSAVTTANIQQYKGNISVPDSVTYQGKTYEVTAIGDSAFYGCTELISVSMGNHIQSIGKHAFNGCQALEKVDMPVQMKGNIDTYVFNNCTTLTSITLPENITGIGSYAFAASGLQSIRIPKKVTTIAIRAFASCKSLKEVTLPDSLKTLTAYAFYDCYALQKLEAPIEKPVSVVATVFKNVDYNTCTLYVPKESISAYQAANIWKNFIHIEALATALLGDLNGDGILNVGDLTSLIAMILEDKGTEDERFNTADLNGDGSLNVGDLTELVSRIMTAGGPSEE